MFCCFPNQVSNYSWQCLWWVWISYIFLFAHSLITFNCKWRLLRISSWVSSAPGGEVELVKGNCLRSKNQQLSTSWLIRHQHQLTNPAPAPTDWSGTSTSWLIRHQHQLTNPAPAPADWSNKIISCLRQ